MAELPQYARSDTVSPVGVVQSDKLTKAGGAWGEVGAIGTALGHGAYVNALAEADADAKLTGQTAAQQRGPDGQLVLPQYDQSTPTGRAAQQGALEGYVSGLDIDTRKQFVDTQAQFADRNDYQGFQQTWQKMSQSALDAMPAQARAVAGPMYARLGQQGYTYLLDKSVAQNHELAVKNHVASLKEQMNDFEAALTNGGQMSAADTDPNTPYDQKSYIGQLGQTIQQKIQAGVDAKFYSPADGQAMLHDLDMTGRRASYVSEGLKLWKGVGPNADFAQVWGKTNEIYRRIVDDNKDLAPKDQTALHDAVSTAITGYAGGVMQQRTEQLQQQAESAAKTSAALSYDLARASAAKDPDAMEAIQRKAEQNARAYGRFGPQFLSIASNAVLAAQRMRDSQTDTALQSVIERTSIDRDTAQKNWLAQHPEALDQPDAKEVARKALGQPSDDEIAQATAVHPELKSPLAMAAYLHGVPIEQAKLLATPEGRDTLAGQIGNGGKSVVDTAAKNLLVETGKSLDAATQAHDVQTLLAPGNDGRVKPPNAQALADAAFGQLLRPPASAGMPDTPDQRAMAAAIGANSIDNPAAVARIVQTIGVPKQLPGMLTNLSVSQDPHAIQQGYQLYTALKAAAPDRVKDLGEGATFFQLMQENFDGKNWAAAAERTRNQMDGWQKQLATQPGRDDQITASTKLINDEKQLTEKIAMAYAGTGTGTPLGVDIYRGGIYVSGSTANTVGTHPGSWDATGLDYKRALATRTNEIIVNSKLPADKALDVAVDQLKGMWAPSRAASFDGQPVMAYRPPEMVYGSDQSQEDLRTALGRDFTHAYLGRAGQAMDTGELGEWQRDIRDGKVAVKESWQKDGGWNLYRLDGNGVLAVAKGSDGMPLTVHPNVGDPNLPGNAIRETEQRTEAVMRAGKGSYLAPYFGKLMGYAARVVGGDDYRALEDSWHQYQEHQKAVAPAPLASPGRGVHEPAMAPGP